MIYTGSYSKCKSGNLISISGDHGKQANFKGKFIREFAPKLSFWKVWKDNIGKIDEYENIKYYIKEYYEQVLINIDIEAILSGEVDPVLLCYEDSDEFCHRHILAEYIELKYGIRVREVEIDEKGNITPKERPKYIKMLLLDVIKEAGLEDLQRHGCFNCEYVMSPELIESIMEENSQYSGMSYEEAEKAIGHCEINSFEYAMACNYYCDDYYPNSECLGKCMLLKRNNKKIHN